MTTSEQPIDDKIIDEIVDILKADKARIERERKAKDLIDIAIGAALFFGSFIVVLVSVFGVVILIVKLIFR